MDSRDLEKLVKQALDELAAIRAMASGPGAAILNNQAWVGPLAAGAQNIAAASQKILCDPTNGAVNLTFAGGAAPADQSLILVKDFTGKSQAGGPITLAAPTTAGWYVENPGNPGNFVNGANLANMASQGGAWCFQAITAQKKIVLVWSA